jgi:hypothetical protein
VVHGAPDPDAGPPRLTGVAASIRPHPGDAIPGGLIA